LPPRDLLGFIGPAALPQLNLSTADDVGETGTERIHNPEYHVLALGSVEGRSKWLRSRSRYGVDPGETGAEWHGGNRESGKQVNAS
jgi:hypothetical protein